MVLGAGLEPARDYSHQILSLMWLPLHHPSISFFITKLILVYLKNVGLEGFEPPTKEL